MLGWNSAAGVGGCHGARLGGPVGALQGPVDAQVGEPVVQLPGARRVDRGAGQDRSQRVAVDADADASLEACLEGHAAPAAEGVEDHVTRAAPACDEVVGDGRRQAAEVGAHRVERMGPSTSLVMPLGRQRERWQGGRGRPRAVQGQVQL